MCNKTTSLNLKPSCMIKEEATLTLKLARKIRTKIRKPKFLSLRLELFPENTQQSGEMTTTTTTTTTTHHHQLNLFPLHPEKILEEKDSNDENVENLFSAADGAATTLTDLLCATSDEGDTMSPSSLTYAYGGQEREEGALVRTAMRNKEREPSEEKWVCYSEVVERKEEEVSSCDAELRYKNKLRRLSLKLDYEEIMNAWSDKGPLYLQLECPQTVPDLHDDDFLANATANELKHGWESNGGLWRVPEISGSNSSSGSIKMVKEEEVQIGGEDGKMMGRQREASVLRYKEKRQNRLFSKKIRYEVRKLNAEKRPRIKGRFVKRS